MVEWKVFVGDYRQEYYRWRVVRFLMHAADFVVSFRKRCICVVEKDDSDIQIIDDFELAFENNV